MRFFTIHERPAQIVGGDAEVVAIQSGFRWIAAFVPMLWLLWHRLWLGLALYVLFSILLGIALALGDIAEPAATAIGLAVSLLIGAGAADYRRWTLERRGWRLAAVLRADSAEAAEAMYIGERGAMRAGTTRPQTSAVPAAAALAPPVSALSPATARGTEAFPRLL